MTRSDKSSGLRPPGPGPSKVDQGQELSLVSNIKIVRLEPGPRAQFLHPCLKSFPLPVTQEMVQCQPFARGQVEHQGILQIDFSPPAAGSDPLRPLQRRHIGVFFFSRAQLARLFTSLTGNILYRMGGAVKTMLSRLFRL